LKKPPPSERYLLRLYISGLTERSRRSILNINAVCKENLHGQYDLEVIDVHQKPSLARGEQISSLLRGDQRNGIEGLLQSAVENDVRTESGLLRKDGTALPVQLSLSLVALSEAEKVFCLIATDLSEINSGVTARMEAEEKIRIALRYTRSLIEASLDPLVTISREGKITDVNEATERVTGVARDRLIGTDFSDYFTEPEKAREGYQQVFAEGAVHDYPLAIRGASGQVTDVLYNASVFRNQAGEVEGVFAAARDATERNRGEEKLRTVSLYTRSLIEASLDPLVTISREGKISDVNQATEKVTGVDREQLIGTDFSDYFTEPEKARLGYRQAFAEGMVHDYPLAIRSISGVVTEVLYNASVFRNQAGEVEGVFAAARDVTERNRLEAAQPGDGKASRTQPGTRIPCRGAHGGTQTERAAGAKETGEYSLARRRPAAVRAGRHYGYCRRAGFSRTVAQADPSALLHSRPRRQCARSSRLAERMPEFPSRSPGRLQELRGKRPRALNGRRERQVQTVQMQKPDVGCCLAHRSWKSSHRQSILRAVFLRR
jgi:PAS domain S-box-containing protein